MIDKTFIINLPRRTDKRIHMENEMQKLQNLGININHEFFDGVDGNNDNVLSTYDFNIPNWTDPNSGKAMTNGEIGCALSHYLIWCKIVELVDNNEMAKDSRVLILEDDIIFPDDFMDKLQKYTSETESEYDMLYIHRKAFNLIGETKISTHINKANRSYWTCAYILNYQGAKKLTGANYLKNLIPVDEFVPIMYGCRIFGYEKMYEDCEKIICYAICPNLLKLTSNAFNDSETFHSEPYVNSDSYKFKDSNGDDKQFLLIYLGPCEGESYSRFIYYCKLYALPFLVKSNYQNEISKAKVLFDEFSSWTDDKLNSTLTLIISVNLMDQCNILPLSSPKEIVNRYLNLAQNENSIVSNIENKQKQMFIGWTNVLKRMLGNYMEHIEKVPDVEFSLSTILTIDSHINGEIIRDSKCEIFYEINPLIPIKFDHIKSKIYIKKNSPAPMFVYSNTDEQSIILNRIENYTGNGWNEHYGYRITYNCCDYPLPKIYVSFNLGYNKKILNILNILDYPRELLTTIINEISFKEKIGICSHLSEEDLFQKDLEKFLESGCDYYFFVGNNCVFENPLILKELLNTKKNIVAPMIKRGIESWSNFWADLDNKGFYRRSFDYLDIVNGKKRGCWNVPYITGSYLIKKDIFQAVPKIFIDNLDMDLDMRMCHNLRQNDIFMYVSNISNYGYIEDITEAEIEISSDDGNVTIYEIKEKRDLWEKKYLHPAYYQYKNNLAGMNYNELCDGIYTFPLFSEDFCTELIERADKFGRWSKGNNEHNDPRLGKNYYENHPTVDVQLFELKMEKQWQDIVFSYIAPVARVLYNNYKTKDINLAFVVKYNFEDQAALAPHHDASTYTINVALNRGNGIDYDGGGCRFIRQDFVLKNQDPGMCCIHPGRLTAYHEGLPVTFGTRYILVSFIN
jgi:GR25 family glycosyltransferase involved in LPS biosynthesis